MLAVKGTRGWSVYQPIAADQVNDGYSPHGNPVYSHDGDLWEETGDAAATLDEIKANWPEPAEPDLGIAEPESPRVWTEDDDAEYDDFGPVVPVEQRSVPDSLTERIRAAVPGAEVKYTAPFYDPTDPHGPQSGHRIDVLTGDGLVIGRIDWDPDTGRVNGVNVDERYQRKGIATDLWNIANNISEALDFTRPKHSEDQTTAGEAWVRSLDAEPDFSGNGPDQGPLNLDQLDTAMEEWFHPQQLDASREIHPKSGYGVEVGRDYRLVKPKNEDRKPGQDMAEDHNGLRFKVRDYGQFPDRPLFPADAGEEPVRHVYRGMSMDEWNQAVERGYISSDRRGVIIDSEGTNAGTEPQTAHSYLPVPWGGGGAQPGVIVKLRVEPEDDWFSISADQYPRTRNRIPIDRIEAVSPILEKRDGGTHIIGPAPDVPTPAVVPHVEVQDEPHTQLPAGSGEPDLDVAEPIQRLDRVKYGGNRTGTVAIVEGDRLTIKDDRTGATSVRNRSSVTRIDEPAKQPATPFNPEPMDSPVWRVPNVDNLSDQDRRDMHSYAWDFTSFAMINPSLRAQEPLPTGEGVWDFAGLAERLTALIDRSSLPADATLYRATFDAPDLVDQVRAAHDSGGLFTEHGFMSTSLDPEKAEEMDVGGDPGTSIRFTIGIDAPKGTKALVYDGAIEGMSTDVYDQQEVLLQRGSRFRVDSMNWDGDQGVWAVHLTLVDQPTPPPIVRKDYGPTPDAPTAPDNTPHVTVPAGTLEDGEQSYGMKDPPGVTIRGKGMDADALPDEVYHVTTNLPAVLESGHLKASGAGGLGGDDKDRIVSLTTESHVARQLADDMRLASEAAHMSPDEALDLLIARSKQSGWDFGEQHAVQVHRSGAGLGYSQKDWLNQYFQARQSKTGERNPLFFSSLDELRAIDPDKVGVVRVSKDDVKATGAQVTNFDLDNPYGLSEVRVYGDVPIKGEAYLSDQGPLADGGYRFYDQKMPKLYHGSDHVFAPGDIIEPGSDSPALGISRKDRVYSTPTVSMAGSFGEHVYEVEPLDDLERDPWFESNPPESFRNRRLRVRRRLDPAEVERSAFYFGGDEPGESDAPPVPVNEEDAPDLGINEPEERDYAGQHQPSLNGPPLYDLQAPGKDGEAIAPDDLYTRMDLYKYQGGPADDESERAIKAVWGDPDAMVTIYRAAPPGVTTINRGDWITLSPTYAKQHAAQDDDPAHDWPVYKARVPASSVRWDGNDLNEFGYDGVPQLVDENTDLAPAAQSIFDHSMQFSAQGGEVHQTLYVPGGEALQQHDVEQARTEIEQMEDTMFGMRDEEGDYTNEVGLEEWENSDGVRFTRYALDVFDEYPEEGTRLWVARSEGLGVAGALSLIEHPEYPDYLFIPYLGTTGITEGTGSALLERAIMHAAEQNKGLGGGPTTAAMPFWRKHGWVSDPAGEGWDFWGWTPEQVQSLSHSILTAHPSDDGSSQPSVADSVSAPAAPNPVTPPTGAQDLLRTQYPNLKIDIREDDDRLVLNRVVVPEAARSMGVGTEFMEALTEYADEHGKQIDLTPDTAFGGSSKARLERFYRRFGFKRNTGRSRDLTSNDTFIRQPVASDAAPAPGVGDAPAGPELVTTDDEGTVGDRTHITREQRGTIPTSVIANMPGVMGEVPGEHRNRQGERWQEFLDSVRTNGITSPIFITVDHGEQPRISEGNHRRDAAVELGLPTVPVQIRYFGHAERQGNVTDRALDFETPVGFTGPMAERPRPPRTWSGKINAMVDKAHDAGLDVEVEQTTEYGIDSITVTVRDSTDPARGALFIYGTKGAGRAVAPRVSGLRLYGGAAEPRKIRNNRDIMGTVHLMAQDYQRRNGQEVLGIFGRPTPFTPPTNEPDLGIAGETVEGAEANTPTGDTERWPGVIQKGDTVRSKSGRLYKVNDAMIPLNAYRKDQRVYDVTDLETGLVNAFTGDEIEKVDHSDIPVATDNGGAWTVVYRPRNAAGNGHGSFRKTGFGGSWQEATEHARLFPKEYDVWYIPRDENEVTLDNGRTVKVQPTAEERAAAKAEDARVKRDADEILRPDAYGPSYLEQLVQGDARRLLNIETNSPREAAEALARAGYSRRDLGRMHS